MSSAEVSPACDEWKARTEALQGVIDRCVKHIRDGMQLQPDEPDAGLEALVVAWTKYHGDCCTFKARTEETDAKFAREEQRALYARDVQRLAAELAAVQDQLQAARELHRPESNPAGGGKVCSTCLAYTSPMPARIPWPCKTAAALAATDTPTEET